MLHWWEEWMNTGVNVYVRLFCYCSHIYICINCTIGSCIQIFKRDIIRTFTALNFLVMLYINLITLSKIRRKISQRWKYEFITQQLQCPTTWLFNTGTRILHSQANINCFNQRNNSKINTVQLLLFIFCQNLIYY